MAILEYASNLSSLFDIFLVLVAVATTGFLIKVKFINAAEAKAKAVEDKTFNQADDNSITSKMLRIFKKLEDHDERINSLEKDVSKILERTKDL